MKETYTDIVKKYYKHVWFTPFGGGIWFANNMSEGELFDSDMIECPDEPISPEEFEQLLVMRKL